MDRQERKYFCGKLFKAVVNKEFKLAKILADGGVDVNIRTRTGLTPLMAASDIIVPEGQTRQKKELIKCLLKNKADVDHLDVLGSTAYMYAIRRKSRNSTVTLLKPNFCFSTESETSRLTPIDQSVRSYYGRLSSDDFSEYCENQSTLTRVEC